MMKNQKILTTAACIAYFVIASSAVSHAQVLINVNIASESGSGQVVLGGATGTYNNFNPNTSGNTTAPAAANSTLFSNAVISANVSSGISVTTGTGFNTYVDATGTTASTAFLMSGYSYNTTKYTGLLNTTLTLGNLSGILGGTTNYVGDAFTLVIYGAGNNSGEGDMFTLSGAATGTANTSGASRNIGSGVGVAYQEFTGTISADALNITVAPNDTNPNDIGAGTPFSVVNGFQLQLQAPPAVPEPSTWAMMFSGLGLLFVITRVRNRGRVK